MSMPDLGALTEGWAEYGDWCPPPMAEDGGDAFVCGGSHQTFPTQAFTSAFSYVHMTQQVLRAWGCFTAGWATERLSILVLDASPGEGCCWRWSIVLAEVYLRKTWCA